MKNRRQFLLYDGALLYDLQSVLNLKILPWYARGIYVNFGTVVVAAETGVTTCHVKAAKLWTMWRWLKRN